MKLTKTPQSPSDTPPENCPCYCGEEDCGWKGIISDCETDIDSEGWEYPEYVVLVCPKCGEYSIIL